MGHHFIESNREQQFLLPEDMRNWISEDEPCWFFIDAVEKMNLDEFYLKYNNSGVGRKPYDPRVMLCLLLYSHSLGIRSSRKIEQMCKRDVSFRIITGNNTPDHATICRFRRDNANLMESVFVEVLKICLKAGILDPGVLAIDSTRIAANASIDKNIEINDQAREIAQNWEGKARKVNTTDPDSRVMKTRRGFIQGFNGTISTTKKQLITGAGLSKESSDSKLLHPMIDNTTENLDRIGYEGKVEEVVADAGYMSEDNVLRENITEDGTVKKVKGPKLYINPKKDREMAKELKDSPVDDSVVNEDRLIGQEKMERRYKSKRGRELFRIRGITVEPVFGQIKEGRGFRRFMMRGLDLCQSEFITACAVHNLMKMHTLCAN